MPDSDGSGRTLPQDLVTVFEAANDTTKELYLGTTSLLIDSLVRDHQDAPPAAISHWDKGHKISYRGVVYSISARDAKAFIDNYAKSSAVKGWKVLR